MKKILLLLFSLVLLTSCNDDCTQDALCTQTVKVFEGSLAKSSGDTVTICHYDSTNDTYQTIVVSTSSLQSHLDHGDSEGECGTLSDHGLHFADGEVVQIDCSYELPFIHTDSRGNQWLFQEPN